MLTPKFLKEGDCIGIVSTARKISKNDLESAVKLFNSWGLCVKIGKHIYSEYHQFAGKDFERTDDFQNMLDDPEIKAIICARGGYGTVRIIDSLNFSRFIDNPKWIVGYSDITVLHSHIHQLYKIKTIHAAMPVDFIESDLSSPAVNTLRMALFGEEISYCFDYDSLNRLGQAQGVLVGGNLSILYSLRGTLSDLDTDDKILFLEDIDEYLYHIDRMMMNLRRGGKLEKLKALLVGGMTDMNDNIIPFGKTAKEIIKEAVKEYNYPVCFGVPSGHISSRNQSLILGAEIKVNICDKFSKLDFLD